MEDGQLFSRYTFLGYDPELEISCRDGDLTIRGDMELHFKTKEPGRYLRDIINGNRSPRYDDMPPFMGGLAGYFSYDYIKYSEPELCLNAPDEEQFKDFDLMLFNKVIVFDHSKKIIYLIYNIKTDALNENYNRAQSELSTMRNIVTSGESAVIQPIKLESEFEPLFSREEFCEIVRKAKRHIYEGNIFQVVLSNRLSAKVRGSLFNAYRVLRAINPSPYMFYFSSDKLEIAGAAPETLVKLENGKLSTFPLAGTRPRGETPAEDIRLERELLTDPKELAEHNMLVDLGRNDLGKISAFGTVNVEKHLSILRFSHVMHIGSIVTGQIKDEFTAIDAIAALLPAGTLSGAPKIRACEIINDLERNKRGIYGGAIGYVSFNGDMDVCIAIRIAYMKNGRVFIRSGGGVVADSIPEKEYEETLNKAKAVVGAMKRAQEMDDLL
jgi:anthranilate synthase component 1